VGALARALSRQLPPQHDTLYLSFSLANPEQLKDMLLGADFLTSQLNTGSTRADWSH
jgi:hypothetical protein